jgi:aryl-alcohol dehydrogenase-like predicted oxidoreductase
MVDLVSVQNQLSLEYTDPIGKGEVALCEERGIAFIPWSPMKGVTRAQALADERGVSPYQVALAWLLSLSPVMVPIPGASRPESILDSVKAAELELTPEELERIG